MTFRVSILAGFSAECFETMLNCVIETDGMAILVQDIVFIEENRIIYRRFKY